MNLKTIKLVFPYPDIPILRQTPECKGKWGQYSFILDDEPLGYDYLVVFEGTDYDKIRISCPRDNSIFIAGENSSVKKYNPNFLKQFGYIVTCQRNIVGKNVIHSHMALPWFVDKDFDELNKELVPIKTKALSIVCSNKNFTEGHRKRLDFCRAIKDFFGDEIDFYGRGIRDFSNKWDVLAPYKYSLCIENSSADDYFTEKLTDCYLAYTYPIYYGAPNIGSYFPKDSFTPININDLDSAKNLISSLLSNDSFYSTRTSAMHEARKKCLHQYNLFPFMVNLIESNLISASDHQGRKQSFVLKSESFWENRPHKRLMKSLYNASYKLM